ncbi:unnamed protein product [Mytilus coruscus]|uniref:C-type lectin domain-containing protein n=1 Tax=Mytilus coruscus TaxID=42192 RepID=A0A6J8CPB5_MYTCO|nr:unnamed protein product [Mytilus coruscus]
MIFLNVCVFILSLTPIGFCQNVLFKAKKLQTHEGKIQYSGAVGNTLEKSRLFCYIQCMTNLKCLTFFYNGISQKCVLHSKTFHFQGPDQNEQGWIVYFLEDARSRCHYDSNGFLLYRELNLCYNFNTAGQIDYSGFIKPTCSLYGGALVKINTQEKQTYISYALEGRTIIRVAIQGHSSNTDDVWTYDDGTPLAYTNWRPLEPQPGEWYLQLFTNDEWTDQNNFRPEYSCIYICEIV